MSKVLIVAKEFSDYVSKKTGQPVRGWSLTFLKNPVRVNPGFTGYPCADTFISAIRAPELADIAGQLEVGQVCEILFEQNGRYLDPAAIIPGDILIDADTFATYMDTLRVKGV